MNLCSSLENPVLNNENISVFALKMFLSQLKNVICGTRNITLRMGNVYRVQ